MIQSIIDKSYQELRAFFDDIDTPLALVDEQFNILKTNTMYQHEAGLSFQQILGENLFSILPKTSDDTSPLREVFYSNHKRLMKFNVCGLNQVNYELLFKTFDTYSGTNDSKLGLIAVSTNESEAEFVQRVFSNETAASSKLIDSIEAIFSATPQYLFKVFVDKAVEITDSKIGFFHTFNEEMQEILLTEWSGDVLNNCKLPDLTHYPLERAGIWADSIRRRKCIIINDYESAIGKKSLPKGHSPIANCISLPIISKGKVVAIIGVGNRSTPYSEDDTRLLEVFSRIVWHSIEIPRMSLKIVQQSDLLKHKNDELEEKIKQRTLDLEKAKVEAEQANDAKSQFLAMMSHELRTPMNAVIGSLDLLALSDQDQESMDLIETAKTSASNLVDILNDILDLSKIEANKLAIESSTFDVSGIIDNIIKIFLPVAEKKEVNLDLYEDPNIPSSLLGDPVRVKQILFNLVGNAVKFTKTSAKRQGNVILRVLVEERDTQSVKLRFCVSDNGPGIDEKQQKQLFQPFRQAELSTTRKYGGTGLGLAICKKLTEAMQGELWVDSQLGVGSSFCLCLDFAVDNSTPESLNTLSRRLFTIVICKASQQKLAQRYAQYLSKEGASVTQHEVAKICAADVAGRELIVLATSIQECNEIIAQLTAGTLAPRNSFFAVQRQHIQQFNQHFSDYLCFAAKPITRSQLVKVMKEAVPTFHRVSSIGSKDFGNQTKQKTRVLVVEDNPFNQKLIVKQLSLMGIESDLAVDGADGLLQAKSASYQLILTDCHMPEMDGYEMTRQIRQFELQNNLPNIPIVAITGAAMSGDDSLCYEAGMNDFLSKPVRLSDLKAKLQKWLVITVTNSVD